MIDKLYNMKNKLKKSGVGCLFAIMLLSLTMHCTAQSSKQSNEKIVRAVYTAYEKKDWNMLKSVLAEGFTFSSPVDVPPIDIKEYKEKCWLNSPPTSKSLRLISLWLMEIMFL